jgi:hypothetical protein
VVVVYRPQPLLAALLVTAVMLGMLVFTVVMTFDLARSVTLDFSRPENTLTITRTYPLLGGVRESIPLSSIHGTQLVVSRGKHAVLSYEVELTTDADPIRISWLHGSHALRDPQKRLIDAFLTGTDPSMHLVYDAGTWAWGLWPLLFCAVPLFLLRLVWLRARVTIDPASRTLRVERLQWPLRSTTESIAFGEVRAVVVRTVLGRKNTRNHRLVLVLGSGQEIALLHVSTTAYRAHARAAERIRAALQQAGVSVGAEG